MLIPFFPLEFGQDLESWYSSRRLAGCLFLLGILIPLSQTMSKASERRLRKIAESYANLLAAGDVEGFRRAWEERVQGWLREIQRRVKLRRQFEEAVSLNKVRRVTRRSVKTEIFEILDSANHLLLACGDAVEETVGRETRAIITSECAKAVASIYDRRLYQPVTKGLYDADG
jgi:hypothetical protein